MSGSKLYKTEAEDVALEADLRPQDLSQIVGREAEKKTIQMMVGSALKRKAKLDHMLFHGPPGLGKTTMAFVIAQEMGSKLRVTSGTAIEKRGDLAALLSNLESNSVLFIDEIHRLKKNLEEVLYPAMEDGFLDIVVGSGTAAKSIRIDLPPFTLVAATTRLSLLSSPLRDRFGAHFHLDFYTEDEVAQIVKQKAQILDIEIDPQASKLIAVRSRKTARVAIRILKRAMDMAVMEDKSVIDTNLVEQLFDLLKVDSHGLDQLSRKYLQLLVGSFQNTPVGLNTLSAALGSEKDTLADVVEPYLLREGFILKTPRGRIATDKTHSLLADSI